MGTNQFMSRMFHPGAWGALEVLVWVLVALMVAFLVVLVIRSFGGGSLQQRRGDQRSQSPLEVLEDRYARGELSDEEFDRRRQVLQRSG